MPRVAARKKPVRKQVELEHVEPQSDHAEVTSKPPPTSDRAANGRFIAGNRGGPGNPHARHCARMLELFRTCISDEEMVQLFRVLLDKAMDGDVSAAKLVLTYKIGKPAACPNPDAIDRDEWDHYQQDAVEPREMQQVLGGLPARVGNDIARAALPIMAEARTQELAAQLRPNGSVSSEAVESAHDASEIGQSEAPIANRFSDQSKREEEEVNRGQRAQMNVEKSGRREVESASRAPIPIGEIGKLEKRKAACSPSKDETQEACRVRGLHRSWVTVLGPGLAG